MLLTKKSKPFFTRLWSITSLVILVVFLSNIHILAFAANVPPGVKLAKIQTLTKANGQEPASLDPTKTQDIPSGNIVRDLFEGLVSSDNDGEVIPAAARHWDISQDGKTYTFYLRDNAKWSNGSPVVASDFVFAWRRLVAPDTLAPYAYFLEVAQVRNAAKIIQGQMTPDTLGVKALDEHTLQVSLSQPTPYFIQMLIHPSLWPVNPAVVKRWGDSWTQPSHMVSNGAYKLDRWVVNSQVVLIRNPQYWDNDKTVIEKVTYLPTVNANARVNRYLAGQIDMTDVGTGQFKRLQRTLGDQLKVSGYLGTYFYQFNNAKPPFKDVRVRKALSYAVDRDVVIQHLTGKGEIPAYTFVPEITAEYTPTVPEYATWDQKERDKKAKALLTAAGFNKDNPLKVNFIYSTNEDNTKIATAISAMWKKVFGGGVQVSMRNEEMKTLLETRRGNDWDMVVGSWIGDYNEASTMLSLFQTGASVNVPKFSNQRFDELLQHSATLANSEARAKVYQQMEAILDKQMPVIPIYHYVSAQLIKPYVKGYHTQDALNFQFTKDMYIVEH